MKKHCFLILAILIGTLQGYAQEISDEEALFYYLKLNRIPIGAEMPNKLAIKPDNYVTYYAKTFDKVNYNQKINDEFERYDYEKQLVSKLANGISYVKFGTQYNSFKYLKQNGNFYAATLGEYSFSTNSFPLVFNQPPRIMMFNDQTINFQIIGNIVNKDDFDYALKMPMETAKELISKRKDASGKVDRSVFVNFTYSVLNNESGLNKDGTVNVYVYKIDVYADKQFTKLGTLLPTFDWHDKILGIRIKNDEVVSTNQTGKSETGVNSKNEGDKFLGTWIGDDPQCPKAATKVVVTKKEDEHYLIEFSYAGDCSDFDGYSCLGNFYENQNKLIGFQKDYNSEVNVEFIGSNKISIPLLAQSRTLYLYRPNSENLAPKKEEPKPEDKKSNSVDPANGQNGMSRPAVALAITCPNTNISGFEHTKVSISLNNEDLGSHSLKDLNVNKSIKQGSYSLKTQLPNGKYEEFFFNLLSPGEYKVELKPIAGSKKNIFDFEVKPNRSYPNEGEVNLKIAYDMSGGKWANYTKFKVYVDGNYLDKLTLDDQLNYTTRISAGFHTIKFIDWVGNSSTANFIVDPASVYLLLLRANSVSSSELFEYAMVKR